MKIRRLAWDERSIEHIARHSVEPTEVEEAIFGKRFVLRARGKNRYAVYGRTRQGRYLLVILEHLGKGEFFVVTARDMSESERKLYRKKVK